MNLHVLSLLTPLTRLSGIQARIQGAHRGIHAKAHGELISMFLSQQGPQKCRDTCLDHVTKTCPAAVLPILYGRHLSCCIQGQAAN